MAKARQAARTGKVADDTSPVELFRSGRDGTVRALNYGSVVFSAVMAFLFVATVPHMVEVDGSPSPLHLKLIVGTFVAGTGLLFPIGMLLYAKRYVSRVVDTKDGAIVVHLVGFLWPRTERIERSRIGVGEGRALASRAPWFTIPVQGRPNLILDLQAEHFDGEGLDALLDAEQ